MPNVKLLLNENVKKLGRVGDLVDVKPGYARNFLIPNGLATVPTVAEVRRIKKKRELLEKQYQEEKAQAEEFAKKFEKIGVLHFELKAGESGKTYGSVTSKNVAEKIKELTGIEIDRKDLDMKKALTSIGKHTAVLKLHQEVDVDLQIQIKKIEDEQEAEAEAKLKAAQENETEES